ncbi:hypothetical protein G3A43_08150 [Paraburkholderia aspalathi]|nr:hypothetical protein [Paraburkholderia aspalathi]MBK3780227.1 hypothetical protein [Paraburkholderia aspalathi]
MSSDHVVCGGLRLSTVCPAFEHLGESLDYSHGRLSRLFRGDGPGAPGFTQTVYELAAKSAYYDVFLSGAWTLPAENG